MKIFISYEHNSWPLAKTLNESLTKEGHTVYWDFHLFPGIPFNEKISSYIADAEHFLLILSPAALTSSWVNAELGFAKALQKNIIPIRLEGVTIPAVENLAFLNKVKVLDWPTNTDITKALMEAMQRASYKDMIDVAPYEINAPNWLSVKVTNNSQMNLYDVRVFLSVTAKNTAGRFAITTAPPQNNVLLLKEWVVFHFYPKDFLPPLMTWDDVFKNGNLLSSLSKFNFQNQERVFSIYRDIDIGEFVKSAKSIK